MTTWSPPGQPVDNPLPPMVVSPYARGYARRHATAHMYYMVQIERMAAGVFDSASGQITTSVKSIIYTGPARIWTVAGPQVIAVGEDQMAFTQTNMSIPWDATPVPNRDDIATVLNYTAHPAFGDPSLIGRSFRVLDVQFGGQMYATRRMSVLAIEESAAWGPDSLR
jgi:hypothetical protein